MPFAMCLQRLFGWKVFDGNKQSTTRTGHLLLDSDDSDGSDSKGSIAHLIGRLGRLE